MLTALNAHCLCTYEESSGARIGTCAGHLALATEQRFIDGLLWSRHQRTNLLTEEHGPQTACLPKPPYRFRQVPQGDPIDKPS